VLVAAAVAGLVAASVPPGRVFLSPLPEYLRIIREHEWRWRASAWGFAVSTVLLAIGLLLLAAVGAPAGRLYAAAAFATLAVVGPCWLGALALRLDLTVAAARGTVPAEWYEAIGKWSGSLYALFMVGGHAAVALLGAALIGDPRVPPWTAWATCVLGAAEALSFWVGWPRAFGMRSLFELPVLVPLVPLLVAIPLAASGAGPAF
jgi:hypothetical protein